MSRPPRQIITRLALCASLAFLAGCVSIEPRGATAAVARHNPMPPGNASSAALRPGDSLIVVLQGIPDPSSNQVQIDDHGVISLPYIGTVNASGETAAGLAQKIRSAYIGKKIYMTVDVSVSVTERYIFVGGEVVRPGRVVWSPDLTVSKAVQAAGGFGLYAKETRVTLVRAGESYVIDVTLAAKSPGEDPQLLPGDSLNVPKASF